MEQRRLGRTGLQVSAVGFGATTPEPGREGEQRFRVAVRAALDAGITLFDTAACYGESEVWLGEELRSAHARQAVVVSKCGHHDILADGRLRSRRVTMADIDTALRRIGLDEIEVMLLHSYDLDLLQQGEALAVLQAAREAGKVRHLGYSGDGEAAAYAASHPWVEVVEMSLSVVDQANISPGLMLARRHRVGVLAKRALANAIWRSDAELQHPDYARRWRAMQPGLSGIDLPPAELALRFVLSLPGVSCALVGARSPGHLQENSRLAARGALPKPAYREVREAFRAGAGPAKNWPALN
jgi:aryl-alcohol dehydrogenase-like predicted oxidoreductase